MFFDKNQAEIGAMLGKSSDWVSVRSRIYKLPDVLKERLRQRPRAIGQMLELGVIYAQHPSVAVSLADRIVNENLTVPSMRKLVRDAMQPTPVAETNREGIHNYRANTTLVQDITNSPRHTYRAAPVPEESPEKQRAESRLPEHTAEPQSGNSLGCDDQSGLLNKQCSLDATSTDAATAFTTALTSLKEAADALIFFAAHVDELPWNAMSEQALDQMETALKELRRSLARRAAKAQIDSANAG